MISLPNSELTIAQWKEQFSPILDENAEPKVFNDHIPEEIEPGKLLEYERVWTLVPEEKPYLRGNEYYLKNGYLDFPEYPGVFYVTEKSCEQECIVNLGISSNEEIEKYLKNQFSPVLEEGEMETYIKGHGEFGFEPQEEMKRWVTEIQTLINSGEIFDPNHMEYLKSYLSGLQNIMGKIENR